MPERWHLSSDVVRSVILFAFISFSAATLVVARQGRGEGPYTIAVDVDLLVFNVTVSGGRAYFPDSVNDLEKVWRDIAGGFRSRYTIGYHSSNPKRDGGFRNVKITAGTLGPGKSEGYYARRLLCSDREVSSLMGCGDLFRLRVIAAELRRGLESQEFDLTR